MMVEADDPNRNQSYTNNQMVRVPRNLINLKTRFTAPNDKNLSFILNSKWSDTARDYGNGTGLIKMKELTTTVNDLSIKYNLWNINLFFNITNVLDEKYETTRDYSQMDRSFNIG